MAGGMSAGRPGRSLAERLAGAGVRGGPAAPTATPTADAVRTAASSTAPRHCWVDDLPGQAGRCPGLLTEWVRQQDGAWSARVVYAVVDDGRVVLIETWVPARHLSAAAST